ncbi:aminoimidazole riboside kinase [Virgibacillus siamensis]|uniref:aminoimidazole riboside kinase n=1 Tax=Virgibacillus siamensis TaxID=480071 RepID=UPI000987B181|nr:aminoimidazole riboside kinase [Virgibacillus siamensis]
MKQGVISLGEALIDFIPTDETNTTYQKSPGGAPANVAVGIAKLGGKSTFLGKVGDDVLGRFLKKTLNAHHVNTSQLSFSNAHRTGLTFVTNTTDGDRSFDFYIEPSADHFLEIENIHLSTMLRHKILHIGSISLISQPAKNTTEYAVKCAKDAGMIVSYDPNLRLALWDDEDTARNTIISMLPHADIVKLSEEELAFITGGNTIREGLEAIKTYEIPLLFVTLGADGCYAVTAAGYEHVPAMDVEAVDTTGAGDAFVSGVLYLLSQHKKDLHRLTLEDAVQMAKFGGISGALAASKKGAMTALPTLDEVERYLAE